MILEVITMSKRATKEEKEAIVQRFKDGETVTELVKTTRFSRSSIYSWIKESKLSLPEHIKLKDFSRLKMQYRRLQIVIEILQTAPCTATAPLRERLETIEQMSQEYNVNILCFALKVAHGTYYNHILRNKRENSVYAKRKAALKPIIEEIYHKSRETYGPSKITAILKDRGYKVSEKTVADIMHANDWFSIRGSAKTLYLQQQKRRENLLKQNFNANRPNEVWVSDVTYFQFHDKTYYICVVLDLYSRMVIACQVSLKNSTTLTKKTFLLAHKNRNPPQGLLFHSDNGSNYISRSFTDALRSYGVVQSYSRKKTPYDNSVCESFFHNMKAEELYRTNYRSEKELRAGIETYIHFYNTERPHRTLRYMTPQKFEEEYARYHPKQIGQDGSNFDVF